MAKKLTAKRVTKKKKVTKQTIKNKKVIESKENGSMGIMLLATAGLLLLVYFGTTVTVETNTIEKSSDESIDFIDQSIIISGEAYSSKEAAMEKLKFIPQSTLTDEEIKFVESYQD